jgi:hypothetical protein
MLMVDTDAVVVERLPLAGELTCPVCGECAGAVGPHALAVFAPGARRCAASGGRAISLPKAPQGYTVRKR